MRTETLKGLTSVRGLRHSLHVRLAVDDRNDPLADERVIFDTQDADATFHNYTCSAQSPAMGNFALGSMDYAYLRLPLG